MQTEQLYEKYAKRGLDPVALEYMRRAMGGTFDVTHSRRESLVGYDYDELIDRSKRGHMPRIHRLEPLVVLSRERGHNLMTNQGLDNALSVDLVSGTQITAWKLALYKTNTSPSAGMTYASPSYTEAAASNIIEGTRQAWTPGSVSSQAVTNSGSPAIYTAEDGWTAYGAAILGGGSDAATIADTAGGGKLRSVYLFGTSKPLVATDTITTTYGQSAADDAV